MIKRIDISFPLFCYERIDLDDAVVVDVETAGLGTNDQCVEITVVGMSCEILFSKLIRPSCPIGESAMSVHRITEEMVVQARTFQEEWPQIERAIGGRKIITWNAAFDARMMIQTAKAHNIILKDIEFYCAMLGYTDYYQLRKWARLTEACASLGIEFMQDHRAQGDVMATLEVIRAMARKVEGWQNWGDVERDLRWSSSYGEIRSD